MVFATEFYAKRMNSLSSAPLGFAEGSEKGLTVLLICFDALGVFVRNTITESPHGDIVMIE